jgi:hypothetical protein
MNELAVAHTLRAMCKSDKILFTTPEEILPVQLIRPFQSSYSEVQGQSWFYVTDQEGQRHRIIVEEAEL